MSLPLFIHFIECLALKRTSSKDAVHPSFVFI